MKRWCQLSSVVAMGRGKSLRESAAHSFVNGWVGHPTGCVVDGGMTKGERWSHLPFAWFASDAGVARYHAVGARNRISSVIDLGAISRCRAVGGKSVIGAGLGT